MMPMKIPLCLNTKRMISSCYEEWTHVES